MTAPHAETEPDLRDRSAATSELEAVAPGTRIGRYVVLSRLGQGGMGVVLAAYDPQLDRKVALKVMHPSQGGSEGREARRLLREAMAMARLTHPNVITVHDVGEHERQVYISMELVEGGTLEQRLAAHPPWPEVLELFIAAGRGLAAAHKKGLVHRDFKPENVMVGDDGRVRVMDFGLAHDASPDSSGGTEGDAVALARTSARSLDTQAGKIAGTPGFIAPELHSGEPADARSDQFAFGVALYEGLFGARPFAGETVFAVAASTMAGQVREISGKSAVPGWVRRIVLRTLAVAPADRFATMDALLDALAQHDTLRRRRRWLIGAGVVLGVVGSIAGARILAARRADARCEQAGAAIDASWNDELRTSTRAGFVAEAPAYAELAWEKSAAWLDRYAEGWRAARVGVCTAATIEHTLALPLEARAIACLDARRRVFDALVPELAQGGESITLAAIEATSGLPSLVPCTDEATLMHAPDAAAVDDATRQLLADAVAALLAGRAREGTELAREASTRAAAAGASDLEIEARMQLAHGLAELGEYRPAVEQCEQAFFLAGRNGDDAVAAQAASYAASIAGFDQRDIPTAMRWLPLAEMSLARVGERETPRAANCLFDLGRAELAAAHYDHAQELLEQARAIYERELDPGHPRVAEVIVHLGIVATDRGQYAQAEQLNARALELFEGALGPQHPRLAAALNNMGNNLDARGQHDAALAMYERALALWKSSVGEDHPTYAQVQLNIAVVHYEKGDYETAMREGQRALAVIERTMGPETPQVANCLNNLVNFSASMGDFVAAEGYQQRALAIREATLPADHPELAGSLAQAGLLVAAQPHPDAASLARARGQLERALSIWSREFGDDHPDSAFALNALGVVLAAQGDVDGALPRLEHALRLRSHPDTPGPSRAETAFALARVLRQGHRDPQRARRLATEALELYRAGGEMFAPMAGDIEAFLAER